MSAAPSDLQSDITCIAPEPFEPRPLVADILRTRYCIPGSIFLVEGVDTVHTSRSKRWRAVRLLLGDGDLCIQALLSAEMHRYVDTGEVAFGSYVRLERFRVEWKDPAGGGADRASDGKGKGKARASPEEHDRMVYLVVEDLVLVGWNNALTDLSHAGDAEASAEHHHGGKNSEFHALGENSEFNALGENSKFNGLGDNVPNIGAANVGAANVDAAEAPRDEADRDVEPLEDVGEPDDGFEVMPISEKKATQNRIHIAPPRPDSRGVDAVPSSGYLPWSSNDPSKPLKLTKLRSIPNLPYKQNWSVNVLAIVSAISDVEPSGLPPYSQRQARLADPSTDKHVLLTVFLDPDQFAPSVGSVVLFLGVKNHRFDGGSLKKYVSDRPRAGERWWFENPVEFSWCDVAGLTRWWEESQY